MGGERDAKEIFEGVYVTHTEHKMKKKKRILKLCLMFWHLLSLHSIANYFNFGWNWERFRFDFIRTPNGFFFVPQHSLDEHCCRAADAARTPLTTESLCWLVAAKESGFPSSNVKH